MSATHPLKSDPYTPQHSRRTRPRSSTVDTREEIVGAFELAVGASVRSVPCRTCLVRTQTKPPPIEGSTACLDTERLFRATQVPGARTLTRAGPVLYFRFLPPDDLPPPASRNVTFIITRYSVTLPLDTITL